MFLTLTASTAWGAKITTYSSIVTGKTYYIGATTGGTDYYLSVSGASTSTSIAGTAKTDKANATAFVFTGSGTSWTIKFADYDNYLGLKSSKDNGKVQVVSSAATFTASNQSGKLRLSIGSYSIQKNNSGTQFGSYGNTQTDIWLEEASTSSPINPIVTFSDGEYTVGGAALDLSTLWESNSTGAVTYSVTNAGSTGATINGTYFTATAAGQCTVQASQAKTESHNAITKTATITVNAAAGGGGDGKCTWELVTDASTLNADDEIIIAAKDYNYALSTTQNNNNRGQAAITKSGSTIPEPSNSVQILTLETGKTSGSLAFNTGSGYLYAASSSSNYLRTETTLSNNSSWTIRIANSIATITAQGSNTNKVMQYNQSSSLFACYATASQKALVLYKKVCTSSAPTTYTVAYALNGGIGTTPTKTNKAEGDEFNLAASTGFSKTGYRFIGWNDGTTTYAAGAQYTMPAENVTFTAQWAQEFTVTYDANGGTPTCTDNNKYIQGETVTICANIPTKSDVTFVGWNDGTNTYLQSATFTMPAKNVTLTAQWKTIPKLATPTNLGASNITTTSATLTWEWSDNKNSQYLNGYNLYYKKVGDANFTGPITCNSKSSTRNGLTPNTEYVFKVAATSNNINECKSSEQSAEFTFKTKDLTQLAKPTNLPVTNITCTEATLSWDAVTNKKNYKLTYTDGVSTKEVTTGSESVTLNNLLSGTTYTWEIQAIGDGTNYANSEVADGGSFTTNYKITYNVKGGTWTACADGCVAGGENFTICSTTPTKTGYNFMGWSTADDTEAEYQAGGTINNVSANTTLYAVWEQKKYTVNWYVNSTSKREQTGVVGAALTDIPEPTTSDCDNSKVFVGWTTKADYSHATDAPTGMITNTSGMTMPEGGGNYYAVFATAGSGGGEIAELVKMTAYDDFNIGDKIVIIAEGTQYGLYQKTSTSNYIDYWTTQANDGVPTLAEIKNDSKRYVEVSAGTATGTIKLGDATNGYLYNSSSTDMSISTNNSSDWSIIAWTDNTFTFEAGQYLSCRTDLSSANKNKWRGAGSSCNCETGNSCSGVIYYNVYKYIAGSSTTYSDYTTTCDNTKATITYDLNGGTGATCEQQTITKGDEFTLCNQTPTKTGYNFAGWTDGLNTYDAGASTSVTDNTKFYAKWTAKTITITWNQNYTGCPEPIEMQYVYDSDENTMPEEPVREGYQFVGWFTGVADGIEITEIGEENRPTGNVTYYAHWNELYSVTFMVSGQVYVVQEDKYINGDAIELPAEPSAANYACDGYVFDGWSALEKPTEDATKPELITASTTIEADREFHAVWAKSSTGAIQTDFVKVTAEKDDWTGDYVIVNEDAKKAIGNAYKENTSSNKTLAAVAVTITDNKVVSPSEDIIWQIRKNGENYTMYNAAEEKYAYVTDDDSRKAGLSNSPQDMNISWGSDATKTRVYSPDYARCFSYYSSNSEWRTYGTSNYSTGTLFYRPVASYTYTTHPNCGPTIVAKEGMWVTSSNGQSVKINVPIAVKSFTNTATITGTSTNENFVVAPLENVTNSINDVVEVIYTPTTADTKEETTITLTAKNGEEILTTTTFTLNGRSLPDEFVIVAQYGDKWLALPANMQSGADQYNGIEVTPNNALTQIPAAPSTTIYSLRGVADSRYEAAGNCVRLVGNGNKCLWGNAATTNTTIQNWTTLGATNGSNYEWLLTTSDGELYTIANPAHPEYNQGRILSNSGSKYGLYKGTTKFYILPVGCSSQPGNIQVTARRVDATFSWEGNASSMKIDVYTNEAMTEGNISNTATASPYYMTGLSESTQYWFEMTPNGTDDDCAYTGSFKTTGPTIDVVEWQENAAVIFVDKSEELNPLVIIDGEVEHGVGTGSQATELFFSKYFEAHAENKLLAIYNGTANTINLTGYTIKSENGTLDLSQFGQTKGEIAPNEEIILVYFDATYSAESCAKQQDNYETWNVLNDKSVLAFSGRGSIGLYKNNVLIDVIGSTSPSGELTKIGKSGSPDNCGTEDDVRLYVDGFSVNDQSSFFCYNGDNIKTPEVENDYAISTNRCLLIRKNSVTSGANAVASNKADAGATCGDLSTTFTTLCSEWSGFRIGGGKSSNEEIKDATCDGLGYVGGFDYNQYYKEYQTVQPGQLLHEYNHNTDTKEYTIPIENLAKYSCLNIRFQLKQGDQVLTEEPVQVPIIVSGQKATNDAIFNAIVKQDDSTPLYEQSKERCKTCNVVVLSNATLTKAADDATNDVSEVYNMKVYPGGQVVVPAGTTKYTVNSLAFRRQEDEVSMANIQGKLTVKHANGVYLDVRIDPSNWHYMTLPYDCRVGDVTFADGTPAVVNTDYLLGWYDGAYRAEHKTGGWTYITDNDYILKKGLGYIVALPGDGIVRREIRFPMANEVIAADLESKTVSGLYAYGGDKTDAELRPNHKGWNMIGSPYLYTYTTDIVKEPLQMGTLEHSPVNPWDGTWVRTGNARYIVEPIDNGWSGYEQKMIEYLKPFTSYFIQVGGMLENGEYTTVTPEKEQQLVFAANSIARNASAPRKVAEVEVTDNHPVWYGVEMIAPNNEKDNTTLLISNEFTDGYDMMDDLVKMRGDYYQYYNLPVLASNNNEGEMAFNALPDSSAAKTGVPLSYYAATAGTYTIATDGRFDLEEVKAAMLYDATTAQYTNLLTDNYSFTTNKGNNTNRFTLFVTVERKKVPNITTGMDNLLANGQLSLIAVERTLVLSGLTENADIYVYDMSGKMVTGTHSAGENGIWRTTVPATGVYFVRVNSANSQQTLRTIVK